MEYTQPRPKGRPTGITILAVLYIISGILTLSVPVVLGAFLTAVLPSLGLLCWGPIIIVGLLYFGTAYGLWTGQNWARILAIILAILGLFNFPIGTIVSIVVLIYLFKDEVKAYFKGGYQHRQHQQPAQQQAPQQQQQQQQQKNACPDCGSQMRYIEEHDRWYCDNCEEYK